MTQTRSASEGKALPSLALRACGRPARNGPSAPSLPRVEQARVDHLAATAREHRAEGAGVEVAADPPGRAVAQGDVEAVGEQAAQLGQVLLLRVERQVL